MAQENTRLKLQLRKEVEERDAETEQESSREKNSTLPTSDGDDGILTLSQDDLVQALNQENRALADRIQGLLAHIELREEEIKTEETQLREHISKIEAERVGLEQENQEQVCLITELTKKTEDDLNTIMELQQRFEESKRHVEESLVDKESCGSQMQSECAAVVSGSFPQNNLAKCVDSLVESVLKGEEPQLTSSQQPDKQTTVSEAGSQHDLQNSLQNSLHVSSLTDQIGQLTKSVQSLKTEQEELSVCLSSLREQQSEVTLSVQTQTEVKQQLTRTVWGLKEEKDGVSRSLADLRQEREQLSRTVCGLKDERDQFIRSMSGLKEEKEQLKMRETKSHGFDGKQEQGDLMREIEALAAELKRSKEELDKSHVDTKRLHSELCQSETRREEAETKVVRLTDVANQMEETRKENESLITQVKELQIKLTGLVREKTDALSLKAQLEEQYNILKAQLNAKTVALEELNSEYITLKQERGSTDDLSTVVISLRTRYNDIRAKYDALLKKRSQNDLDITPLKANQGNWRLRCLVVKCQERCHREACWLSRLIQMMKAMNRRGGADSTLTQQVEQLLSDPALQDYTATFTPGSSVKTSHFRTGFTPEFISTFQDYTNGFTSDQTCCVASPLINQQCQNGFTPIVEKSEKLTSLVTTESRTDYKDSSSDVTPAPTGTLKKNADSSVQEHGSVQATPSPVVPALTETLVTDALKLYASACGPEKSGFHHPDKKGKFSPDLSRSAGSSPSPPHPSSASTRVSPSRRLSSPEKIINLHEQLQKTLTSSYQACICCIVHSIICLSHSPERSNKFPTKTTAALEKTKTARPKPEAPAKVRSVEVIKTVGQSNLMIGWERPPLDELGCSNGTFVYGYRVFVDGDFHKSVMSSACTKCVLENIDLSVPVHISVQTLGSNGLSSNSVHTTYRTSLSRTKGNTLLWFWTGRPSSCPGPAQPVVSGVTVRMTGCAKRCKQGLIKFALSLHKLVTGTLIKGAVGKNTKVTA
ncbi:hypothetical protein L3Q82_005740 [Scortum barcoo]|uniref:Uncharacterized protein n=1 Tax=Scortum barcoo TaxID=214431 RepID=A0ACB8V6K7_9TELE|nr:hypothetical protein L3Q82_005740 [Scortum barcoo]